MTDLDVRKIIIEKVYDLTWRETRSKIDELIHDNTTVALAIEVRQRTTGLGRNELLDHITRPSHE